MSQSDCIDGDLNAHEWQPLSFVFETQLLDAEGRVLVRQPAVDEARVYCVCMKCRSHTYVVTTFAGYYLGSRADFNLDTDLLARLRREQVADQLAQEATDR